MAKDYTTLSLPDIEDRIAVIRDNIRQLTEQAAGSGGAADEERTANRLFDAQAELDALIEQRDEMLKKKK